MITLIQLNYIIAVDKHRNFLRASEACFVTQPTLSMQIKKLEDDLGVIIFDRSKKPLIATELGHQIIEQAKIAVNHSAYILELIRDFNQTISGNLHIGIIPTLSPYLVPLFAGSFKKKYPQVQLSISEMVTADIARQLHNDELDAGIFVSPFHDEGIKEWPLFYEEMMVYASLGHPLIEQTKIRIGDIDSDEIWLLSDGHCFRDQVINLCSIPEVHENKLPFEFDGGSLETMMKVIDKEGGYTLVPELAVLEMSEEKQKQIRSFQDYKPLREVSLVYSRNFAKSRLLNLLHQEITDSVPASMIDKGRGNVVEWKE